MVDARAWLTYPLAIRQIRSKIRAMHPDLMAPLDTSLFSRYPRRMGRICISNTTCRQLSKRPRGPFPLPGRCYLLPRPESLVPSLCNPCLQILLSCFHMQNWQLQETTGQKAEEMSVALYKLDGFMVRREEKYWLPYC